MMKTCVGIDFGTCNIKVVYKRGNKVRELKLHKDISIDSGDIPNVILYDKKKSDGGIQRIIGRDAVKKHDINNTVYYIKKKLQQADWKEHIDNLGKEVNAQDVATDIFRIIKESIYNSLKDDELEIAITMPVCYAELQKQRIYESASKAGINVKAVLSESFAAAFSQEDILEDGNVIFIFDFGGATLDVSVVRIEDQEDALQVEEIASCGINYGGTDIDEAILAFFENKYGNQMKEIERCDLRYKDNMLQMVSELKEQLFSDDEDEVEESHPAPNGEFYNFVLTRDDVENILKQTDIKENIISMLDDMFDQLDDVIKDDVTHVRLFGGSSYIPYFPKILTEYFGEEIFDCEEFTPEDYDENAQIKTAVASGTARYMSMKDGDAVNVINRIPFHIGIKQKKYFKPIVDRNRAWGDNTTGWITLDLDQLKQDNFEVKIYQSFANVGMKALWNDLEESASIIYMATLQLKKELYDFNKTVYLKLYINTDGKLEAHLAQMKPVENNVERVDLEKMIIGLGG